MERWTTSAEDQGILRYAVPLVFVNKLADEPNVSCRPILHLVWDLMLRAVSTRIAKKLSELSN